jgi:hypothetical protein
MQWIKFQVLLFLLVFY